jgi:BclB C-terminal domain-containing protein
MKSTYLPNISFQKPKRASITLLFALVALTVQAQVGIGTITPDASAQLDVQSTNKGVLIPRMPEAMRLLILSPATGLLVYQTDGAAGFYFYDGVVWQPLKAAGESVIIPYASATPIVMTALVGGAADKGSAIGFGNSTNGLTDADILAGISNMAFTVPRAGVITTISATFISTSLPNPTFIDPTVSAQLYKASAGSNTFAGVPGGGVTLPPFVENSPIGTTAQATVSGLNIPVSTGERLMLVFFATGYTIFGAPNFPSSFAGHASAGVEIK